MESFQVMKKRMIKRPKGSSIKKQRTLNYSTTSASNLIYQSFSSITNNSNYEEQLKRFEEYSKYHFSKYNNKLNKKCELNLLKSGINSIINYKPNFYIKLSPIKRKEISYNSFEINRTKTNKKINIRNIISENNNNSILEKLKNYEKINKSNKISKPKNLKYMERYEYVERQRDISKIKNKCDIGKEEINKIKRLYKNENNILNEIKSKLKKSIDHIKNIYDDNTKSSSSFIFTIAIKESKRNDKLLLYKKEFKNEIKELEKKINKLKKEKNIIINWIYLFIKIKENRVNLPKYYCDIFEENISFNLLRKKYNNKIISKEEYDKINSYKKNLVFNEINEFSIKINSLNKKILIILKENYDKLNDKKNKYEKLELEQIKKIIKNNEKEKNLIKELNELKYKNKLLKETYRDKSNNYNKYKKEKENGKLFLYIVKLFKEFQKLNFSNIEININFLKREEKIILDILECFENNLIYLLVEKKQYYSNEKMREIYKKEENKIMKEREYMNFLKQNKMIKKLLEIKIKKFELKLNKKTYLLNKKINYNNHLKTRNNLNKVNKYNKKEEEDEKRKEFILYS